MFRFKIFISVAIFSFLLIGTSIVKNQTREIEKKIFLMSKKINFKQKDFYETQLDFSYLTSPAMIEKRINRLDIQYSPVEYSKIFLSIENLIDLENKIANQNNFNEKKSQKK